VRHGVARTLTPVRGKRYEASLARPSHPDDNSMTFG